MRGRSVSRVLYRTPKRPMAAIYLGTASPQCSSDPTRPDIDVVSIETSSFIFGTYLVLLRVEIASFHPLLDPALKLGQGSRSLCCSSPGLATDGRYPLRCSVELGLSSPGLSAKSGCPICLPTLYWFGGPISLSLYSPAYRHPCSMSDQYVLSLSCLNHL